MTCGQRMQKRGPVRATARNIGFYDAFISFSGLKSTFPNWGRACTSCPMMHDTAYSILQYSIVLRGSRKAFWDVSANNRQVFFLRHMQPEKPRGNALVQPDKIYHYVKRPKWSFWLTTIMCNNGSDTVVNMGNHQWKTSFTVNRKLLKPCRLCWNQNRESSRTAKDNPV